jgi:leader peptidase (prepilin peptidase)/N-methyltransferase
VWLRFGFSWASVIFCAYAAILITLSFIDLDTQEIPDRFHIMILCLGIASVFAIPGPGIAQRLIGAACISLPMLVLALLTGGFGMGDIKLVAASGFLVGWQASLVAALIGCITAAAAAAVLIALKKRSRKDKIAFGPYLAMGFFVAALYADQIINAYLGLFSYSL